MSHEAPRFLALEPQFFSTTAAYSFVFAVKSNCSRSPSQQRRPRITVKGISRHNFRPVRFYRTLNLAIIVRNTYV